MSIERAIARWEDDNDPLGTAISTDVAERRIQRILLELEEDAGRRIDFVRVDTRNYANCSVEIFWFTEPVSQPTENAQPIDK